MTRQPGRWVLSAAAVAAGCVVGLGFAPFNQWYLVPAGVAAFVLVCLRSTTRVGLLRGYLFGWGFNAVAFHWSAALGLPVLAVFVAWLAVWQALVGLVIAATRRTPLWGGVGVAAWMAAEWAGARWPLGGFGWGRLAFTALETPVDGWFPFLSVTGVSCLIVTTSFLLAWVLRPLTTRYEWRTRLRAVK
ncbi:MAG: hypothetical protein LBI33_04505, partial [Propionibacteriaceae bacterium]|nr:hypothetical protein [Propionibacteriaceae bacterium]